MLASQEVRTSSSMVIDWQWEPDAERSARFVQLARQAAANSPQVPQSWATLSNLLSISSRDQDALCALVDGMERCPDDPHLQFLAAQRLRSLAEYEKALEHCDRALRLSPGHAGARVLRFALLVKTGQLEAAERHVEDAVELDPCEPYIFEYFGQRLAEPAMPEQFLRHCEAALARNPSCGSAVYFKALVLAKLGSPDAARELLSVDRDVHSFSPEIPAGWSAKASFLDALAEEILRHPSLHEDPRGKSTSRGLQTGSLQPSDGPAIAALIERIRSASDEHASRLQEAAEPLAAGRPSKCSLNAWAVVLGSEGRQRVHRHPDGWLSGVFYVHAPRSEKDAAFSGDLVLGGVEETLGLDPPWGTRRIEPVPGRLVLFPSFMPHATTPSGIEGQRISVAFDVIPAD
jgi:tetratricopeptide (TPR) repeat protein